MACYFCDGSRTASVHSEPRPDRAARTVGAMKLGRRYDGAPLIRVDVETETWVDMDVEVGSSLHCSSISADVEASAYVENVRFCPFCGAELAGK